MKRIICACVIICGLCGAVYAAVAETGQEAGIVPVVAQETPGSGVKARLVGTVFRSISRAFVVASDVDKLKKNAAAKISAMSQRQYQVYYADIYEDVAGWPYLEKNYQVRENMPKDEALRKINSLNKDTLYQIVDSMPDDVAAREYRSFVRKYMPENKDSSDTNTMVRAISAIIESVKRKYCGV